MRQLQQKEIHNSLLDILSALDRYCTREGLRYSMAYGTLLGAVRHKGFIPWDDDIDVLMPRPDFEKLVAGFNGGTDSRYRILYNTSDGRECFVHFFAKIHDPLTVSIETKCRSAYRFGLNIDIFPVDGKPDTVEEQKRHEALCHHLERRLALRMRPLLPISFHNPLPAMLEAHSKSISYWFEGIEGAMKKYPFEGSLFAGSVATQAKTLVEIYPTKMFEEYTELEFEGRMFKAFKDYDGFLRQQFGDYMTPPPPGKRATHHLQVFEK